MQVEGEKKQIDFVNPEKDNGKMANVIKTIYDALLEHDSLKEVEKGAIDSGFEIYKEQFDSEAKKGDYSAFVKGLAKEMFNNKVSEDVEKFNNILDHVDVVKKYTNQ